MGSLKDEIQNAVHEVVRAVKAGTKSGGGANINVAGRTNTVVSRNVGSSGVQAASSRQTVRIRQNGDTVEESVVERVDTAGGGDSAPEYVKNGRKSQRAKENHHS